MHKRIDKLSVRIIIAVALGLLFASINTHLHGPCATTVPGEDITRCIEVSKAVMHPNDLLHNKQNSLVDFSTSFLIVSVTSFALFSAYSWYQHKKS